MAFRDDLVDNPTPPITARAVNDEGGTYWVLIDMDYGVAGRFVRELWEHVGIVGPPQTDDDALNEWTDRQRDVRTNVSPRDGVLIRTHAWHPQGDRQTLHQSVIDFLKQRGFEV